LYKQLLDLNIFYILKAMKATLIILFAFFWFAALYFGWIHMIGKTMKSQPKTDPAITAQQQNTSRQKALELQQQQQELLRQRQDRMRDMMKR
jgi:hypothetical protein